MNGKHEIWVMDCSHTFLPAVADMLADAGYQVVIFECHEDALSALRERAPHGIKGE